MQKLFSIAFLVAVLSYGAFASSSNFGISVTDDHGGATVIMTGEGGVIGFCFFGVGGGFNLYCGPFTIVETPSGNIEGHIGRMVFVFGTPVESVATFEGVFPENSGIHPEFAFDCVVAPGKKGGGSCIVSNP